MGQKSSKADKNIYHLSREEAGLTREAASEKLYISPDRIEKIEMRGATPHPDEILSMADTYRKPLLCNYYCSHECEIGRVYVPELKPKDVSQITLEVLSNLNKMVQAKDRLIEITVDGVVHDDEVSDFGAILSTLDRMSAAIESLRLWARQQSLDSDLKVNDPSFGS